MNTSVGRSRTWLHDVALFHWVVQYQDCRLGTTKKLLNGHQTLFLVRGWGLGMRLKMHTWVRQEHLLWISLNHRKSGLAKTAYTMSHLLCYVTITKPHSTSLCSATTLVFDYLSYGVWIYVWRVFKPPFIFRSAASVRTRSPMKVCVHWQELYKWTRAFRS